MQLTITWLKILGCPVSTYGWTPQGQKLGVSGHRGHQWIVAYDIYRLQSAHTASPVCTAIKTTSIASNYAFHFHRALKFRLCIFFKCSSFSGTPSSRPPAGASPLNPTGGLPSPDPLIWPPTPPSRPAPAKEQNGSVVKASLGFQPANLGSSSAGSLMSH